MESNPRPPGRWQEARTFTGSDYDANFDARAQAGQNVHGEADFVESLGGRSILDAGCGTGRVAIELARRGHDVVGVDADAVMLDAARRKAPHLDWRLGDLVDADLGRTFDLIVMAGNVMIFVQPGTEAAVVANLARHLRPGGLLVAGFQLTPGGFTLDDYDAAALAAGLALHERWATWHRDPWQPGGNYAVSVHRKP